MTPDLLHVDLEPRGLARQARPKSLAVLQNFGGLFGDLALEFALAIDALDVSEHILVCRSHAAQFGQRLIDRAAREISELLQLSADVEIAYAGGDRVAQVLGGALDRLQGQVEFLRLGDRRYDRLDLLFIKEFYFRQFSDFGVQVLERHLPAGGAIDNAVNTSLRRGEQFQEV